VISAAKAHLDKTGLVHAQVNIGHHETMLELVDLLVPCLPGDGSLDTLFFSTTGAEAVENAVKVARCFTGKHAVVSAVSSYILFVVVAEKVLSGDY
jgi:4-aminobutyrate aminotransferase